MQNKMLAFLSFVMTIVLAISILSVLYFAAAMLFLPTPSEYKGSFPTEPQIFTSEFWRVSREVILRHWALLQEHITTENLIRTIGMAFTTLLIYRLREMVIGMKERNEKIQIHDYVELGYGSIISTIILLAATRSAYSTNAILILSISAFIIYIIHPQLGILFAIRDWIRSKIPKAS